MRLLELNLFLFLLFSFSSGIEFKLKQLKADKFRCAYKKYIGENDGEFVYKLKESATACLDELPSPNGVKIEGEWSQKSLCEIIFRKKDDELRPEACDNEWIQPLAKKCRKTCGTCCELPEFKCNAKETIECNEIDGILAKSHSMNLWFPILLDHCPSTAGLCKELKKKEEEEKKKNKKEEKERNKGGWIIPIEEDCRDKKSESYCALKISSCNKNIILRRCRKTCGDCLPENFKCKNKEKHKRRCKLWAGNGFCRRDGKNKFTLGVILKYCPLTCGLCKNEEEEERKKRKEEKRKEEEKMIKKEYEREMKKKRKMRELTKLKKEEKENKSEMKEEKKIMDEEKGKNEEEKTKLEKIKLEIKEKQREIEEEKTKLEKIKLEIMKKQVEEEKKLDDVKKQINKENAILVEVKREMDEIKAKKRVENEEKFLNKVEELKLELRNKKEKEEKEKQTKRNLSV